MAKILIRNRAEPDWKPVIEAKLGIMLGSMLEHISRMDIEFDQTAGRCGGRVTYICKVEVTAGNGKSYLLHNHQPDANLAIEGAIARARRTITRLGRAPESAWSQASAR